MIYRRWARTMTGQMMTQTWTSLRMNPMMNPRINLRTTTASGAVAEHYVCIWTPLIELFTCFTVVYYVWNKHMSSPSTGTPRLSVGNA